MTAKKREKQELKKLMPKAEVYSNSSYGKSSSFSRTTQHSQHQLAADFDREFHAKFGKYWPLSPASLTGAYLDWLSHIAFSPGKQASLLESAIENGTNFLNYILYVTSGIKAQDCINVTPKDKRFDYPGWQMWPYNIYKQGFLLTEEWWNKATSDVRGVTIHHSHVLPFLTRQYLDMWAPLNFPFTNPQVVEKTFEVNGMNFIKGAKNLVDDVTRFLKKEPPIGTEKFEIGKDLAATKGKVIYQNRLIELIQYSPLSNDVYAEPILIVPAWIMKYYILDLSPHNSLVKYLLENNHTVFMISWKNPDSADRDLGFEDYVNLGIMEAIEAISAIIPNEKIHGVGYCLGGTLLAIAVAAMSRKRNSYLKTVTLFASQVDFEDAGELLLFIDESQIAFLEDIMWEKGYLDSYHMAGTFDMLHSYDLVWSKIIETYLLGERLEMTDLMAWNADGTRMPYKMHSEYLRELFLRNALTNGKFKIGDHPVSLHDIQIPLFVVATQKDHISPWKSVHKIHLYTDAEITFLLTNGGHNAGIVSEPGHPHRTYQFSTHKKTDQYPFPEEWFEKTPHYEGSWWPAWNTWLEDHSSKKIVPPTMGNPTKGYPILREAPGNYVMEK